MNIILASTSPFRRQLLSNVGIEVRCVDAEVDESAVVGQTPSETALLRADLKANAVACRENAVVIGCDQVLSFDGHTFGKPKDRGQAIERLNMLSGKKHTLISAASIYKGQEQKALFTDSAQMHVRPLTQLEIETYVDSCDEWRSSSGGYQFENKGAHLFEKINGDYFTVIGMPLLGVLKVLREIDSN